MTTDDKSSERVIEVASSYAREHERDVLLCSGELRDEMAEKVISLCRSGRRRKNVLLVLATYGGDARAAYRIARCVQAQFEKVDILIGGLCKSAGTLLAIGAHRLIISHCGELGPLDVQVLKDDGLGERTSGLTPGQALLSLDARSRIAFRSLFLELKNGMMMTTRTAADISSSIVGHLYGGIYAQIDPMRLGELQRAQSIGFEYAKRLDDKFENLRPLALEKLAQGYSAHNFAIDALEARDLFHRVDEPNQAETQLLADLDWAIDDPSSTICMFLSEEEIPNVQVAQNQTSEAAPESRDRGSEPSQDSDRAIEGT